MKIWDPYKHGKQVMMSELMIPQYIHTLFLQDQKAIGRARQHTSRCEIFSGWAFLFSWHDVHAPLFFLDVDQTFMLFEAESLEIWNFL